MKLQFSYPVVVLLICSFLSFILFNSEISEDEFGKDLVHDDTSGPEERMIYEYSITMDPHSVEDPYLLLREAYEQTLSLEKVDPSEIYWEERGPTNVGGRTRAIMWDPNDPLHLKFWAGGVSGGLWYTNNILTSYNSLYWQKVDDFWSNLAITCIAYDPTNTQLFYVGTGEGWFEHSGIPGGGIWKSSDGGETWYNLINTSGWDFRYVNKILVHPIDGYVYAATRRSGVWRSTDQGVNWNVVLSANDSALSNWAADLEITANNDILVALGNWRKDGNGVSDGVYISPTGDFGDWTRINDGTNDFPTAAEKIGRIELEVAFSNTNIIYALVQDSSKFIKGIYKSIDKGINWEQISTPMLRDTIAFPGDQTLYDLIAGVFPLNPDIIYVGGVSIHRSTDGGSSWEKIEGIHPDHHALAFRPGNRETLVFGNDGGVYLTEDCTLQNPIIKDRNQGYRVTQYHGIALHPVWGANYFLGGTQDNGTQQLSGSGMNSADHVLYGDGGECYILKSNPLYQIASTQYNRFYLSTDGGNTFDLRNPIYEDDTKGKFISHWDYDEINDVMYASYSRDSMLIIKNVINPQLRYSVTTSYNNLFSNWPGQFKVSPFSDGTIFVGTEDGRLFKITNAHSLGNYHVIEITGPGFDPSWINCIELGANEDQILVIFSWYGVISIWETLDGGTTWDNKDDNLPDMPIRWAIYNPLDYRQVMLATETGILTTEDITANPVQWLSANSGMGNVRTTMLKIRESDNLVIAGTYGRGIFSTNAFSVSPSTKILASDGEADDDFGTAVATNGDFVLVGAPYEDEKGSNAGAVYFYEQLNNQWTESAKVLVPDGEAGDVFGGSVDMIDDLAIIGARGDGLIGAAYIYRLSGSSWNLESKITPSDGSSGDNFGHCVTIFGDKAVVGATNAGDFGAVYVFTYQSGSWIQTDKIVPNDGETGEFFGHSVDLDGDYLVVGNPSDNDNGILSGSAYIYHYDNGWTLDKKVTAINADEYDRFGYSVAIDGQNIVIGAFNDEGINGQAGAGSAYIFFNTGGSSWEQTVKLQAQDAGIDQNFGNSVSIFGHYIIVGAEHDEELDFRSGAAYVFRYDIPSSNWVQQNKIFPEDGEINDLFGHSVQLFGTGAIVSSIGDDDRGDNSGSAHIFKSIINENNLPILSVTPPSFDLTSANTTVDIQITNNGVIAMDWYAYSLDPWLQIIGDSSGVNSGTVTISVDENLYCPREGRIIVRAPGAIHSPREVFIHQEAGTISSEVNITPSSLNSYDHFGWSVDVDGEYAIVGAPQDSEYEQNAGAAYIYERDGCCTWVLKAKLRLDNPQEYDEFGFSVALSGDVALVGIRLDNSAYIFEKPAAGWQNMTETARLFTSPGAYYNGFGESLDISGGNVIVGAYANNGVFFYDRPPGGWQDMTETVWFHHDISDGEFGRSVAIDGMYAVVGAHTDGGQGGGAAYVFKRDWAVWGEQTKLVPSDGQTNDWFGGSVDIDGDRIIVGSRGNAAAYIFVNNEEVWVEEQKLTAGSHFASGRECVTIDNRYALVGAAFYSGTLNNSGSAYSFVRGDMGWSLSKQIFSSDLQEDDWFGAAVSMTGPYTIIGAYGKANSLGAQAGAAYIYCTEGDIVISVETTVEHTLPIQYDLKQNYPNPFNPVTTIVFDLPRPTDITLKIYTILGEEVTTIVSDILPAGTHKFTWDPVSLASGVYLYRIESKEFTVTKKMILIR